MAPARGGRRMTRHRNSRRAGERSNMNRYFQFGIVCTALATTGGAFVNIVQDRHIAAEQEETCVLRDQVNDLMGRVQELEEVRPERPDFDV